jgi:hypothetical protein
MITVRHSVLQRCNSRGQTKVTHVTQQTEQEQDSPANGLFH